MKKSQLYDRAEQLYVEELRTYEQIAAELGCSDRTLRNWSKQGRWDTKRIRLKDQQESLSDEVRQIALLLAKKLKDQLGEDIEPSPHILNAFTRMASSLLQVRSYDKSIEQDMAQEGDASLKEGKSKEAAETFRRLFGTDLSLK